MFADVALARRIERAEATLSATMVGAVLRAHLEDRPFVEAVGAGYAVYGGPGSPFSKLIGAGLDPSLDLEALTRAERAFAERGSAVRAEVCVLANPEVFSTLAARGYAFETVEHVLGRRIGATADVVAPASTAPAGVEVAVVGPERTREWIQLVVDGFASPDVTDGEVAGENFSRGALERVFGDYEAVDGFSRYLASIGAESAGGAGLCIGDGIAMLSGASTLPRFRRRGVQTALLHRRLADAGRAGCDLAVVTTAPGSTSQKNVQRQGFAVLYARAVLVKPANPRIR